MGAQAIQKLLGKLDLEKEIKKLRLKADKEKGDKRAKTTRRIQYLEGFMNNNANVFHLRHEGAFRKKW